MEPVTGFFVFNAIANGLINFYNGRQQRRAQESLSKETMEMQRENMLMQLEQQRRLHRENNQAAIANQLRTFALTNTWPLNTAPDHIAACLRNWRCTPLCFIVAPMASSNISSKLQSTLQRLKTKILVEFQPNSDAPVIQYEYKPNFPVNPANDISSIYDGIKCIPTLYIAPCLMDNDRTLSITIASWGLGGIHAPAVKTIEIDIRKLYIDQLRDDAYDYKEKCDKGELSWDDTLSSAKNYKIFEKENLEVGFDWLDNQGFYSNTRACDNTFEKIGDRLLPFMTVFSVALIDMYNVLVRSTTPRLPKYLNQCKHVLPDLRVKQLDGTVNTIKKEEYVESLCRTYVEYIANYADVAFCKELIPCIEGIGENYKTQMNAVVCKRIEIQNKEGTFREGEKLLIKGQKTAEHANEVLLKYQHAKSLIRVQKYQEAFSILLAIVKDCQKAYIELGECYMNGWGCDRSLNNAVECFRVAVNYNIEGAKRRLGHSLLCVKPTNKKLLEDGINYLNCAARDGDLEAMYLFAYHCMSRSYTDDGLFWLRRAAELGHEKANEWLNKLYEEE